MHPIACFTGYASSKSTEDGSEKQEEKWQIHMFPSHQKEPEKRALSISKFPRVNWKPRENEDLRICEKHCLLRYRERRLKFTA